MFIYVNIIMLPSSWPITRRREMMRICPNCRDFKFLKTKGHPVQIPLASEDIRGLCMFARHTLGSPKHSRRSSHGLCGGNHLILLKLASVSHRSLSEDGWWLECRVCLQRRYNRAFVCTDMYSIFLFTWPHSASHGWQFQTEGKTFQASLLFLDMDVFPALTFAPVLAARRWEWRTNLTITGPIQAGLDVEL